MEIRVCIKQVPDFSGGAEVCFDPSTGNLLREKLHGVFNPLDRNALEAGIRLRERFGGRVIALSMGPPQAQETLREALVMGADEAVLISGAILAGSDTWATAYVLSKAILHLAAFDLVLCGAASADGDTAHVGPSLAEFLSLPQVTFATSLDVDSETGVLHATKITDAGSYRIACDLPAVVSATAALNTPRSLSLRAVAAAAQKEVKILTPQDLAIDAAFVGTQGSPTHVERIYQPVTEAVCTKYLQGEPEEMAWLLTERLKQEGLL